MGTPAVTGARGAGIVNVRVCAPRILVSVPPGAPVKVSVPGVRAVPVQPGPTGRLTRIPAFCSGYLFENRFKPCKSEHAINPEL